MNNQEWLAGLQAGDEVMVIGGEFDPGCVVHKVTKTTKSHVFCGYTKYRKKDGLVPNDPWMHMGSIAPVDPQLIAISKAKAARKRLEVAFKRSYENVGVRKLSLDDLEAVQAIFSKYEEDK